MNNNNKRNGLALAGFLCSLFGLFTCGFPSIIGLILSAIGLHTANETGDRKGLAIAGLVMGIVGTIIILMSIIGMVAAMFALPDDYSYEYNTGDDDYEYYETCDISFRDAEDNLVMSKDVLKYKPAKVTQDDKGNPAIMLTVKDKDTFYNATEELSKKTDRTLVIWTNFDEYYDKFETEKANCGKEDSHCLIYATASQGFASDVIITGNYTEEEAKSLADCINNSSR